MKIFKFLNIFGFFALAGLGSFLLINNGCQKTDHPLGVYAPNGLDRPTQTATPSHGAIQVYVQDSETAIQGVTVLLLDPSGNTVGSATTQPVVGFASFDPAIVNGTWTAEVLTGGVSYIVQSSGTTINHYYYQSSQTFPVTGAGNYAVTFLTGTQSVSVFPVSQVYPAATPQNIPLTVTYNQIGNLNVPVSIQSPTLPTGWFSSIDNFILGEGVTQEAVTINKTACYATTFIYAISAHDFTGYEITSAPATLYRGFPISVTLVMTEQSEIISSDYNEIFTPYFVNDCGGSWNYKITQNSGSYTGSLSSGHGVTVNLWNGTNAAVSVWSNIGSASGSVNPPTSGSVTIVNTSL